MFTHTLQFHTDCVDGILRKSNSCPLDGYVIYNPLTWRTSERKTSPKLASCLFSDCAKRPENDLKDLFIPGVALRGRNTKIPPSHSSLNLEVLSGSSVTLNTPQKLITDRFQGLCIESQRKQTLLIPESSSSFDHLSKSDSKKNSTKPSPASPTRCAAVAKIREQPQLNLFVGSLTPESGHTAAVASPARRTRLRPKRTGVVTIKDTNNRLISELRMTGVLINTQHQRETGT